MDSGWHCRVQECVKVSQSASFRSPHIWTESESMSGTLSSSLCLVTDSHLLFLTFTKCNGVLRGRLKPKAPFFNPFYSGEFRQLYIVQWASRLFWSVLTLFAVSFYASLPWLVHWSAALLCFRPPDASFQFSLTYNFYIPPPSLPAICQGKLSRQLTFTLIIFSILFLCERIACFRLVGSTSHLA